MAKRPSQESSGKATWFGWKLFEPRDAEGKHSCKICHQKIKYNNTTANLKSHYELKHRDQWAEAKEKKDEIVRMADLEQEGLSLKAPSILEFLDPSKIEQKIEASKKLIKSMEQDLVTFIVGDIRPFHAVEGPPLSSRRWLSLKRDLY